jgi:hypothetical protein
LLLTAKLEHPDVFLQNEEHPETPRLADLLESVKDSGEFLSYPRRPQATVGVAELDVFDDDELVVETLDELEVPDETLLTDWLELLELEEVEEPVTLETVLVLDPVVEDTEEVDTVELVALLLKVLEALEVEEETEELERDPVEVVKLEIDELVSVL